MTQSGDLIAREFTLDGRLAELGRLAGEVARFCRENGLGQKVEFDLQLALEELFTNALRHGGCEGRNAVARVRLERTAEGVQAEFWDAGHEFDPQTAPAPDLAAPLMERPAGGWGLHLVRHTMHKFE